MASAPNIPPRSLSAHRVLPPIITNERDRLFLAELNEWISDQLSQVDESDTEQNYTVYKEVFSKVIYIIFYFPCVLDACLVWIDDYLCIIVCQVIDHIPAYRSEMIEIKAQYEQIIDILAQGRHEAFFLQGKLSELTNAPRTLRNYKRRAEDLEKKYAFLSSINLLSIHFRNLANIVY